MLSFHHSVVSISLQSHGLQHIRLFCPLPSPRICLNSCPLILWRYLIISTSATRLLLLSIFPTIRVFSKELTVPIRWPKYWNFSNSPSHEYSELISFRIDWFDLVVQGIIQSLLQHHNSKASILWHSVFFVVQLSHLYMTTGKTIALTIWNFFGKVISMLFNMLSWFVIAFLPRSKHFLISWLQSPSALILEPKKIKFAGVQIYVGWIHKWMITWWLHTTSGPQLNSNLKDNVCLSLCPESEGHKRRLMIWRVMGPAAVAAAFRAFFLKRHSLALMTWFYWLTTELEIMMLHMHEIIQAMKFPYFICSGESQSDFTKY